MPWNPRVLLEPRPPTTGVLTSTIDVLAPQSGILLPHAERTTRVSGMLHTPILMRRMLGNGAGHNVPLHRSRLRQPPLQRHCSAGASRVGECFSRIALPRDAAPPPPLTTIQTHAKRTPRIAVPLSSQA